MMGMVRTSVKVSPGSRKAARINVLNANPRTRAAAARLVNDGARAVIRIAEEIASDELKERPDHRRRHPDADPYVESFFVDEADFDSIGRMVARFGNHHPAANIIEWGTNRKDYPIEANAGGANSGNLVFPWDPPHTHSRVGGPPGDWPVDFGEGTRWSIYAVTHPGTDGFHIMRRARDRYRRRSRNRR